MEFAEVIAQLIGLLVSEGNFLNINILFPTKSQTSSEKSSMHAHMSIRV